MSYYYGQPVAGPPNPNLPYPPQSPYPAYPAQPQQPMGHAPANAQSYFGYANVPSQAMPNYGQQPQAPMAMAYNHPGPIMSPTNPNARQLPTPTFRSRPASVVLPPTMMASSSIPQGPSPGPMHMHNMSVPIVQTNFVNPGPVYNSVPQPMHHARPASVHGFPGWNGMPQMIPPVSPIYPSISPTSPIPPNLPQAQIVAPPSQGVTTPPTAAPTSDPNKRQLPPPPPGGSAGPAKRALPTSPSLPPVPPKNDLPRLTMSAITQSLPSIPTSAPMSATPSIPHSSTTPTTGAPEVPTKTSSPTKRSLPAAPGGGGIMPGTVIPPRTQTVPPTNPTTSQSSSLPTLPQSSVRVGNSPSPVPTPTRSSTTPLPAVNPSPPPTSAPSSYASARSTFTPSPPPTGRPQSNTSDGGEDKRPLWKRMAAQHSGSRPQSVFGHRYRASVDESASKPNSNVDNSGGNSNERKVATSMQRTSSPLNTAPIDAKKQEPQVASTSRGPSPIPPAPSPTPNRAPLPNPPSSSTTPTRVTEQKMPEAKARPGSAIVAARQNPDHPLPRPPPQARPITPQSQSQVHPITPQSQSQREVRFSKAAESVGPSSPPRVTTSSAASPPRAIATSPPRASAMKSGTKTPVNGAPKSRSEIISTSPPRVPPATRSSPLPPSPSRPGHSRQATAPAGSSFSTTSMPNVVVMEEPPKVSMALRFASEDVAKQGGKDWARWALKTSHEVVENPTDIDGKTMRDSGRRRSASTGEVDPNVPPPLSGRSSFDTNASEAGVVLSTSAYASSRRGGARPMPSSNPASRSSPSTASQSPQHSRITSEEFPQYRPSYTDSDSEDEGSSYNPRITVSTAVPQINVTQMAPQINVTPVPQINVSPAPPTRNSGSRSRSGSIPAIHIQEDIPVIAITVDEPGSKDAVVAVPVMNFSVTGPDDDVVPQASTSGTSGKPKKEKRHKREKSVKEEEDERERARQNAKNRPLPPRIKKNTARCGKCDKIIVGRIVSAMGARWHPECFRCTVCETFLEHVSSYEHDDRPYCHLDYHELFAPRCFHCKTPIMEEHFITLDDDTLGKRTYHEQHFFCAECGDPFLAPKQARKTRVLPNGMIEVVDDDEVGFTVYKGHPYCESCHVRLRMPKCKRCKKSIRPGDQAIEALGGKWCWDCFTCDRCSKPFEDPQFYEHNKKPYCQPCYSIILVNQFE